MIRSFAIPILVSAVCLWLSSCSEDPGPVGLGVLPAGDSLEIRTYETVATGDTAILTRVVGGSSALLAGRYESLEARTLVSFTNLSSISQAVSLDSARLDLRINYRFRDSAGTVGFEAHKFLRGFTGSAFTWDTATATGAFSDTISGSLLETITSQDSLLRISLDTVLIRQWIQAGTGSLILLPTGNIVIGISPVSQPTDLRPALRIFYNGNDTTPSVFRMASGVFVANGTLPAASGNIPIQAGVAQRGIIRFDSLGVPDHVSVTQAILELAVDTTSSILNTYSNDAVVAFLLRKNAAPFDSVAIATKCAPSYNGAQKIYRADVKAIVQQWLLREPNYGFLIRASGELSTFDHVELYGSSAPSSLRPKLTITYTRLP